MNQKSELQIFAILDTCVLLPARLSDVLFDLMIEGLYSAHWTADIEAEFLRNWNAVHPHSSSGVAQRRLNAFRSATNHAHEIWGYQAEEFTTLVPKRVAQSDKHLVAAALVLVKACQETPNTRVVIVSNNLKDLAPAATKKLGIDVISAGAFVDQLYAESPGRVTSTALVSITHLKKPPYTPAQFAAALRLHGVKHLAQAIESR